MMPTMRQPARLLAYLAGPVRYGTAVMLALIVLVAFLLTADVLTAVLVASFVLAACLLMVERTDSGT
jgi:hypothetical protein